MTPSSRLRSVLDCLPFAVDDTDAANDAFRRWVEQQDDRAERLVELWTYCYVCRYFLSKSIRGEFRTASDADALIARAYEKVRTHRDRVRNPDRYAHWVSVVCKNTFLNHMRRDYTAESINTEKGPTLSAKTSSVVAEMGFVREAFADAIDQLPNYLREPAEMYFLEGRDFKEISAAIDKPVPTVRTYKHKATKRLREDETLREYVDALA